MDAFVHEKKKNDFSLLLGLKRLLRALLTKDQVNICLFVISIVVIYLLWMLLLHTSSHHCKALFCSPPCTRTAEQLLSVHRIRLRTFCSAWALCQGVVSIPS